MVSLFPRWTQSQNLNLETKNINRNFQTALCMQGRTITSILNNVILIPVIISVDDLLHLNADSV